MPSLHAVVYIDHHAARVLQFDPARSEDAKAHEQRDFARQHSAASRSEDAFFADICMALEAVDEIVVMGAQANLADFRRFVEGHRRDLASSIAAYEVSVRPSNQQLLALSRRQLASFEALGARSPDREPGSGPIDPPAARRARRDRARPARAGSRIASPGR